MGTMIQDHGLAEADYRGARFSDHAAPQKGNNDLLSLTQPGIVRDIHAAYLAAGADIVETNTFNSTAIAMADYLMEDAVYDLNFASARIARAAADAQTELTPERPRFVAGVLGPTNRTASISPDVNDPGVAKHRLRDPRSRLRGGYVRPGGWRGRRPADRDGVRRPQLQGGDLRGENGAGGARRAPAADDLRHHHRRQRPDPDGADARSVRDLHRPCRTPGGRTQLRAGRGAAQAAYRRDRALQRGLCRLPSECGTAPTPSAATTRRRRR